MGMLGSTEAFDGGGIVRTSGLKWNKRIRVLRSSPRLIITSMRRFIAIPYPPLTQYKGMGASYLNTNFVFSINNGILKDPYESTNL